MKKYSKILQDLSLSQEESQIYLTCLEFGTLPVSQISQKTGIGRVNTYHYIDKLLEKGLLIRSQKSGAKTFSAENPRIFINREKTRLNLAQEIVPELLSLNSKNPQKPKIQFFEGEEGIKKIFQRFLEIRNTEMVSFSNFEKLQEFFDENFLRKHFAARLENQIKTRFISPRSIPAEKFITKFLSQSSHKNSQKNFPQNYIETFLISPDEFYFDSEITIFAGTIAILNLNPQNPIGFLVENSELYHTQKAIFDLAWLGATSFITR